MRTFRKMAVILLALFVGVSLANAKSKPHHKTSRLSAQQRPAQPSPTADVLTSQQIKQSITDGINAAAQQYEANHPAPPPDNSGWWFNFLLVVFTGGLVVVGAGQGFLIFFTLKATQVAAKAAQTAADAIQITERPYIFIWGLIGHKPAISYGPPHGGFPQQIIQENAAFIYSVSNRGKLTAVIENVSIACGYERNGQYPPLIAIGDHYLVRIPLISPEKDVENIPFDIPWKRLDVLNPTPEFKNGLIFHVVISYRGPFTKGHETSLCWRYVSLLGGFAEDGARTYAR